MTQNHHLVYLAHTNADLYNELIFSVYSFKRYHSENKIKIIVYTDNVSSIKEYLKEFDITYIAINQETIKQWMEGTNFIYKTKIACLIDASSRFTGNFLLVDTDTYFTNQCYHLFQQIQALRIVLHVFEKHLDRSSIYKGLLGKTIQVNETSYQLTSKTEIWNSGVIGISSHLSFLLKEANQLCAKIYELNKRHIAEQLALSVVFQKENKIINADYAIFHYWNLKEFRPELKRLLTRKGATEHRYLQELICWVNPVVLLNEKREWRKLNRFRMPLLKLFDIHFRLQPIKFYP